MNPPDTREKFRTVPGPFVTPRVSRRGIHVRCLKVNGIAGHLGRLVGDSVNYQPGRVLSIGGSTNGEED